jgi:hypothetical protein
LVFIGEVAGSFHFAIEGSELLARLHILNTR